MNYKINEREYSEIVKGIEIAQKSIDYELGMDDLADVKRIEGLNVYINDMSKVLDTGILTY
tara:strand:+ start:537 stop:719 length:183 start_codon:yes stop_codon:yes gene_type:complete